MPGLRLERIGEAVVLMSREPGARHFTRETNLFRCALSIPGEVRLPGSRWVVSAEAIRSTESGRGAIEPCAIAGNGPSALIRADRCQGNLAVRNRRPGDRFQPVGLAGHKKLQDFFVDRKIARGDRDAVPLVVDERDRIVWVAGHRIDETFRVTDGAQAVLLLRLRQT